MCKAARCNCGKRRFYLLSEAENKSKDFSDFYLYKKRENCIIIKIQNATQCCGLGYILEYAWVFMNENCRRALYFLVQLVIWRYVL